jgi:hypothetical protein
MTSSAEVMKCGVVLGSNKFSLAMWGTGTVYGNQSVLWIRIRNNQNVLVGIRIRKKSLDSDTDSDTVVE